MFTEDKVTEIFFMADEFCGFFDSRMEKYALRDHKKRIYHRESTMSGSLNNHIQFLTTNGQSSHTSVGFPNSTILQLHVWIKLASLVRT